MTPRSRNPYEGFKSDRHRLFALVSRDLRIVLVAAIFAAAGFAGVPPALGSVIALWLS